MTSPFVKYLLDMLSDLGDVRSRAMFGGYGIYHDGVMIGLIATLKKEHRRPQDDIQN